MNKLIHLTKPIIIIGSLVFLASPATALAAKTHGSGGGGGTTATLTGNDVSWPQCNNTLPSGQLFGIVGVNGGLANDTNSCFASELAWAETSVGGTKQGLASLYVNTANPGNSVADWPKSDVDPVTGAIDTTPYGTCTGGDDQACAYQYGWNMADLDAQTRIGVNNPSTFKWWLDVETANSWETNTANNSADLEGMVAYFESINAQVGLYSTPTQWTQIAGTVSSGNLVGLDSWLPGARNLSGAENNCKQPGLTGGVTTVTQYVTKQLDYDYSCI